MTFNKSVIGIITALLTFIIVKVIFSRIGIENIPVTIIITLLVVSYTMFIGGVNNRKLIGKEKTYFILCASLLAIFLLACIVMVVIMNYYRQILIEHSIILLVFAAVAMISLIGAASIAIIVKRGRS